MRRVVTYPDDARHDDRDHRLHDRRRVHHAERGDADAALGRAIRRADVCARGKETTRGAERRKPSLAEAEKRREKLRESRLAGNLREELREKGPSRRGGDITRRS